jgi:hypothetical protein
MRPICRPFSLPFFVFRLLLCFFFVPFISTHFCFLSLFLVRCATFILASVVMFAEEDALSKVVVWVMPKGTCDLQHSFSLD